MARAERLVQPASSGPREGYVPSKNSLASRYTLRRRTGDDLVQAGREDRLRERSGSWAGEGVTDEEIARRASPSPPPATTPPAFTAWRRAAPRGRPGRRRKSPGAATDRPGPGQRDQQGGPRRPEEDRHGVRPCRGRHPQSGRGPGQAARQPGGPHRRTAGPGCNDVACTWCSGCWPTTPKPGWPPGSTPPFMTPTSTVPSPATWLHLGGSIHYTRRAVTVTPRPARQPPPFRRPPPAPRRTQHHPRPHARRPAARQLPALRP